jgi:hypothetical protein
LRWTVALALPLLAIVVGASTFATPAVEAANLKASLGVGCSIRNGDVKLSFSIEAKSYVTNLDLVQLTLDGTDELNVDPNATSYKNKVVVDVPNVTDEYDVVLNVSNENGDDVTRTALAKVTINGNSVKCSVKTPNPNIL